MISLQPLRVKVGLRRKTSDRASRSADAWRTPSAPVRKAYSLIEVRATALFDAEVPLGYESSYPSFVRQLRQAELRPHCEACAAMGPGDDPAEAIAAV